MDDSAVFALRAKFVEDLEELLECPVCFERPKDQVSMCVRGHHVCKTCRDLLFECPVCKSRFSPNARNFVAEELCSKLNDIISSLLEPQINNSVATPLSQATVSKTSISTQTDSNSMSDESVIILDDNTMSSCRIGFCQAHLPADCMYHHVCDYHRPNLVEATFCSFEETYKDFKLNYDFEKLYDFAVNCKGYGLFFMKLHIDKNGDLFFTLQTTNASQENKFSYELSILIPRMGSAIIYDGVVPTSLTAKMDLRARECNREFFKRFFLDDLVTLRQFDERFFTLSLIITRI